MQLIRYMAHKFTVREYEMPPTIGAWKKSVSGMERFVDEHINVTEYMPNLTMDDVRMYGIEALIVGSDQIWRPVKYDAVKYYFLGFAKDSDIRRVAYAPSVALDEWPFMEETTVQLRHLIKKFSAVSVREESSVQLVKENLGVDAQWVLDPTMLLAKEDYLELCKNEPKSAESFVFAYILDMTSEKRRIVEQLSNTFGCKVKYLTADKVKEEDTIERWLANFRDARFVITDSYHGTVFSLIFQKHFYCFYNNYRGKARMDSLKKISGLVDRFGQDVADSTLDSINYVEVEKIICDMRHESIIFLKNSLEN